MKRWYVAQTHAHAEAMAGQHLARQDFDVYLPRYRKLRRHARRTDHVLAPMFPRYLFVALDVDVERWRAVHSTVGVQRLICHGEWPAPVPVGVVEEIRRRQDENGAVLLFDSQHMRRGDAVRVVDGAFVDRAGIFECVDDKQRVVILLDLLGRQIRLHLDQKAVAAA